MRWLKRNRWKAGIAIASILLLLVLTVWLPTSAASAYEVTSGLAGHIEVIAQATPTVDATVSTLSKEQLTLQVKQLQNQLQTQNNWFFSNSNALIAAFSAIIITLFGISQWAVNRRDERRKEGEAQDKELKDRQAERERRDEEQKRWLKDQEAERDKRAEERFQAAVTGLGDEKEGAKIGAAILLRTFLHPGYEQFYTQTFDLAVANLRLPRTPHASEDPDGVPYQPKDQASPLPLTTLSQALIVVFKEAFPLARTTLVIKSGLDRQSLDATNIQLDNASLEGADLKQIWMPQASLRKATLNFATLSGAILREADLREADLVDANLSGIALDGADLSYANLSQADLNSATLTSTTLSKANFNSAILSGATFFRATLREADLSLAILTQADLTGANLTGANLSEALQLHFLGDRWL